MTTGSRAQSRPVVPSRAQSHNRTSYFVLRTYDLSSRVIGPFDAVARRVDDGQAINTLATYTTHIIGRRA